jgi:hypothetical protein
MNEEANGERGKEALKVAVDEQGAEAETNAQPDVSADRGVPPKDAAPERASEEPRSPPLGIKEIEELEDDAPGG